MPGCVIRPSAHNPSANPTASQQSRVCQPTCRPFVKQPTRACPVCTHSLARTPILAYVCCQPSRPSVQPADNPAGHSCIGSSAAASRPTHPFRSPPARTSVCQSACAIRPHASSPSCSCIHMSAASTPARQSVRPSASLPNRSSFLIRSPSHMSVNPFVRHPRPFSSPSCAGI